MTIRQEQFVVDKEGNRIGVVLNIQDYQKLLADVEELESIRAFDEAKTSERNPSLLSELLPRSKLARNELLPFHPAARSEGACPTERWCLRARSRCDSRVGK